MGREAPRTDLGLLLKEARHDKDLTQIELARKTGISRNAISAWEAGGVALPRIQPLMKVTDELAVDPELIKIALRSLVDVLVDRYHQT